MRQIGYVEQIVGRDNIHLLRCRHAFRIKMQAPLSVVPDNRLAKRILAFLTSDYLD